jgi:histidine triad (HIT) family protein
VSAGCIFCGIARGEAPASAVYSDETVLAFMDIQPVITGHVLVIPRVHAANLTGLDDDTAARVFNTGKRIGAAYGRAGLPAAGFNVWLAQGEAAGQEVFHAHLHVVPRFAGDGFSLRFPPHYGNLPPRSELDETAARIRRADPHARWWAP